MKMIKIETVSLGEKRMKLNVCLRLCECVCVSDSVRVWWDDMWWENGSYIYIYIKDMPANGIRPVDTNAPARHRSGLRPYRKRQPDLVSVLPASVLVSKNFDHTFSLLLFQPWRSPLLVWYCSLEQSVRDTHRSALPYPSPKSSSTLILLLVCKLLTTIPLLFPTHIAFILVSSLFVAYLFFFSNYIQEHRWDSITENIVNTHGWNYTYKPVLDVRRKISGGTCGTDKILWRGE